MVLCVANLPRINGVEKDVREIRTADGAFIEEARHETLSDNNLH